MGNNRSFIVNFFILAVLIVSVSSCTCTFSYQMFTACADDVNEFVIDENMIPKPRLNPAHSKTNNGNSATYTFGTIGTSIVT